MFTSIEPQIYESRFIYIISQSNQTVYKQLELELKKNLLMFVCLFSKQAKLRYMFKLNY